MPTQAEKRKLNKIKKNFPFQIDNEQAKSILKERELLDAEKEQILEEYDIGGKVPTPQEFYGSGQVRKDFYELPAKIWENQEKQPISEEYDLGIW